MPLQFRQIVELGRRHATRLGGDGLHLGPSVPDPFDDAPRLACVCRKASGFGGGLVAAKPGTPIVFSSSLRGSEAGHYLVVVLGHEGSNGLLAFHQECEGGRLHPPNGEELSVGDGGRPREVHAHEPIGAGPTVGRIGEGVEVG